ncbi:unnamed protein product [Spirodela intermedia]|uniref:Uncharacterized protein n=1 Tax=Spirodela intermedia TaxID=51605 RepID=A0A7I8ILD9_SPIIN|nr:unnamed protein product [Spirodela intermedia]CAA6658337.1 unnamed protein product [Spirodela intermedia]
MPLRVGKCVIIDDHLVDFHEDPLPTQGPPPPPPPPLPPTRSEMSHFLDAICDLSTHVANMDTHLTSSIEAVHECTHQLEFPKNHDRCPPAPYDPYDWHNGHD